MRTENMETVELYSTFGNVYFILSITYSTYSFVSLLDVHTLMITHYTHYS